MSTQPTPRISASRDDYPHRAQLDEPWPTRQELLITLGPCITVQIHVDTPFSEHFERMVPARLDLSQNTGGPGYFGRALRRIRDKVSDKQQNILPGGGTCQVERGEKPPGRKRLGLIRTWMSQIRRRDPQRITPSDLTDLQLGYLLDCIRRDTVEAAELFGGSAEKDSHPSPHLIRG